MNDETHSWGAGGIFGQSAEDALEVADEMDGGPYPDGMGGFRDRPGLGNRLGAEDAIRRRRDQKKRRDAMLLAERFIDELPDLRDKIIDSFGADGLRGKIRDKIIERLRRGTYVGIDGIEIQEVERVSGDSVPRALGDRMRDTSLDVAAEVFLRAYNRDIKRSQAAVRLGAFEPEEWAQAQAQKALATPSAVAKTIMDQAGAIVARARHVAKAISEPLEEPEGKRTEGQ
jgi:hypothetical protein